LVALAPRFRRRCRIRWLSRIAASSGYPDLLLPSGQGFSPVSRETFRAAQRRRVFRPFGSDPGSADGSPASTTESPPPEKLQAPGGSRPAPGLPGGSGRLRAATSRIPAPGAVQPADDVPFSAGIRQRQRGAKRRALHPSWGAPLRWGRCGRILSGKVASQWAGVSRILGGHPAPMGEEGGKHWACL
jgi:hypothetical protein